MNAPTDTSGNQLISPLVNQASNSTARSPLPTTPAGLLPAAPQSAAVPTPNIPSLIPAQSLSPFITAQAGTNRASPDPASLPKIKHKSKKCRNLFSRPAITDGRYDNFVPEQRWSILVNQAMSKSRTNLSLQLRNTHEVIPA
jgi:hypothetical protein